MSAQEEVKCPGYCEAMTGAAALGLVDRGSLAHMMTLCGKTLAQLAIKPTSEGSCGYALSGQLRPALIEAIQQAAQTEGGDQ